MKENKFKEVQLYYANLTSKKYLNNRFLTQTIHNDIRVLKGYQNKLTKTTIQRFKMTLKTNMLPLTFRQNNNYSTYITIDRGLSVVGCMYTFA